MEYVHQSSAACGLKYFEAAETTRATNGLSARFWKAGAEIENVDHQKGRPGLHTSALKEYGSGQHIRQTISVERTQVLAATTL
jgi:hypothetical protein